MTCSSPPDAAIIRPMRESDLDRVQEIDRLSFSLPWPDRAYQYELHENELSSLWVAEVLLKQGNWQVAGMIVVWFIVDEAHIATLAVAPEFRGHGLAKSLVKTALEAAININMNQATLEVRANNIPAQQLYKSFGFEIVGRRPRYYRDNHEDALIMTITDLSRATAHESQPGD